MFKQCLVLSIISLVVSFCVQTHDADGVFIEESRITSFGHLEGVIYEESAVVILMLVGAFAGHSLSKGHSWKTAAVLAFLLAAIIHGVELFAELWIIWKEQEVQHLLSPEANRCRLLAVGLLLVSFSWCVCLSGWLSLQECEQDSEI